MSRSPITKPAIIFIVGIIVLGYLALVTALSLSAIFKTDRSILKTLSEASPEDITAVNAWIEKHQDAVICLDGKPKGAPLAISISKPGRPTHQINCIEALIAASSDPIRPDGGDSAKGGGG
ncbi:MAG: hypothetical protein ISN28_01860 [Ectothiorhodospiraceae bacterium AqS1]|nr:hypothetical protein [Ectothiorhodospiraceae bacterium AqS1]